MDQTKLKRELGRSWKHCNLKSVCCSHGLLTLLRLLEEKVLEVRKRKKTERVEGKKMEEAM